MILGGPAPALFVRPSTGRFRTFVLNRQLALLLVLIGLVGLVHGAAHIALGMVAPSAELPVIVGLYYVLPCVALARRRIAWLAFAGIGAHGTVRHFVLDGDHVHAAARDTCWPTRARQALPKSREREERREGTEGSKRCVENLVEIGSLDPGRAIEAREDAMREGAGDIVELTERVMRHSYDEDALRTTLRARYGERGMIDLAYAIAGSQVFPYTKKVLGHGGSCTEVTCE